MTASPVRRLPFLAAVQAALLGPRLRSFTGENRYRADLIVITCVLVAACGCVFVGLIFSCHWNPMFAPSVAASAVILALDVWWLRRTGQIEVAALTLCVTLLAVFITVSWLSGGLDHSGVDWVLLVAVFAPTLLRPSLAIGCIAVIVVNILFQYAAGRVGYRFPALSAELRLDMSVASQLALALLIASLSWVYDRARRDALAERDAALATLEESRDARLALVENVKAVVYSIDRDLRLIAGNSLFERLSHSPGESRIRPGQLVLDGLAEAQHDDMRALYARAFAGEHFGVERRLDLRSMSVDCEILFNPIRRASGEISGVTVFGRDISERKAASAELQRLNGALAEMAHVAGKAEVATDVLHNVGNVLTGLNSSANLIAEQLRASKVPFVGKTAALLPEATSELAQFLTADERGRQLAPYLRLLAAQLEHERAEMTATIAVMHEQLGHVKSVVARQQMFAHARAVLEVVPIESVIDAALQLIAGSSDRVRVAVATDIAVLPPLALQRTKLLEILTNLLANSFQALDASPTLDKRIHIRVFRNERGQLEIDVTDNGMGIAPEHLARLFSYGFTTKLDGHGFGLAGCLLAARAMGGTMRASSSGPGQGATFTLELPFRTTEANPTQERAA